MEYQFRHSCVRDFFDVQDPARKDAKERIHSDFLENIEQFLIQRLDVPASSGIGQTLFERMSDSALHYHTPVHILSMLQWAQENEMAETVDAQLAIWFHDSIYSPSAPPEVNERQSAEFMKSLLGAFIPHEVLASAEAIILATAKHMSTASFPEPIATVLDLDLISFAFERPSYEAVREALAQEYASICSMEIYRAGRTIFLERLIGRGFIYRTSRFKERWETKALTIIQQSLREDRAAQA